MVELSLFLLQLVATLALVGLIWFVQVVHYPLFEKVGGAGFCDYEQSHQERTTWVVAPLMLIEATTALLMIVWRPSGVPLTAAVVGVLLVASVWASTFFWQVPAHRRLAQSFQPAAHRRLVASNWLRTAAWTARGALVGWLCLRLLAAAAPLESAALAGG